MRGLFVTGTGTGVGKTIAAAALCAALVQEGQDVLASKPLLSGMDEAPPAPWPHDHELLALVTGAAREEVAPRRFGPAVSPHLAARWEGVTLTVDGIAADLRRRIAGASGDPSVVVEGAGGLLVPIDDRGTTVADLALELDLPLVVVAHPGLGTINHVQLTLEAARARDLQIAAVVLTPWPAEPSPIEADNLALLTSQAGVPVLVLAPVSGPDPQELAAAGVAAGLHRLLV